MVSGPLRTVAKAAVRRASGKQVGVMQALVAAAIAGVGAAVVTYKVLRS